MEVMMKKKEKVTIPEKESDMRKAKVPWPQSEEELTEYINSLVYRNHDYGTCVYAMSMAAVAAFQYVSQN
jgi:hypothetical protein